MWKPFSVNANIADLNYISKSWIYAMANLLPPLNINPSLAFRIQKCEDFLCWRRV